MTKIPEEAVERMEALVRRMERRNETWPEGIQLAPDYAEAKTIVAMLPEPVDPLLVEAREWCDQGGCNLGLPFDYQSGAYDHSATIRAYLAGARAQQAKLTPTAGPDGDGWIKHTPGDPMPCGGNKPINVRLLRGQVSLIGREASYWDWSAEDGSPVIAWRPAR